MRATQFKNLKLGDLFFFNEVQNQAEPELLWHQVREVTQNEIHTRRISRPRHKLVLSNGKPSAGIIFDHLVNFRDTPKLINDHGNRPVIVFN